MQENNRTLREEIQSLNTEIASLEKTIETERGNLEQMRLNRVQLAGRAQAHRETAKRHGREIEENARQIGEVERQVLRNGKRAEEMTESVSALHREHAELEEKEHVLREEVHTLEGEIASDNKTLKSEEQNLKQKMQELAHTQEQLESVQVKRTEKRTEIRALYDSFSERHGRDLREFEGRAPSHPGDQKALREEIADVRSQIKELGSVNLMAVEEFGEVSDRYEFLSSQIEDLRSAREDLVRVTAEIKRESEQLFVDTYNRIRKTFIPSFGGFLVAGGRNCGSSIPTRCSIRVLIFSCNPRERSWRTSRCCPVVNAVLRRSPSFLRRLWCGRARLRSLTRSMPLSMNTTYPDLYRCCTSSPNSRSLS